VGIYETWAARNIGIVDAVFDCDVHVVDMVDDGLPAAQVDPSQPGS
jgi:hypothetical protein